MKHEMNWSCSDGKALRLEPKAEQGRDGGTDSAPGVQRGRGAARRANPLAGPGIHVSQKLLIDSQTGLRRCPEECCGQILQTGGPCRYLELCPEGHVEIQEYPVFPGIWLVFRQADTYRFVQHPSFPAGLLEITHCREGRLEYQDGDRHFVLGEGDMAIHKSGGGDTVLRCPVRRYSGVSLIIDPAQAPPCTSCFLGDVEVRLPELVERFCGGGRHFLMRSTPQLEHLFSQLYHVPEAIRKGYFKVKALELLLFLSCLEPEMSQEAQRSCTEAQARLARQAIAWVDTHRSQRFTAQELAMHLQTSPEQLRASIRRVYGRPLYQCIRAYKMRLAARLLRETDRTVMDVAGEMGYDNGSKFAAAFREVLGCSPGEYRQAPALQYGAKEPQFGVDAPSEGTI